MGNSGIYDQNKVVIQYVDLAFLFDELDARLVEFLQQSFLFFDGLSSDESLSFTDAQVENRRNASLNDFRKGRNSPEESLAKIGNIAKSRKKHVLKIEELLRRWRESNPPPDAGSRCEQIGSILTNNLETTDSLNALLQAVTEARACIEIMGELHEDADRSFVDKCYGELVEVWNKLSLWDDQRSVQLLGEWGTRFFHVMRYQADLPDGWLRHALELTIAATPKQRRKEHVHSLWKRQHHEEKLSYGQIAKKHKAETGVSISASAVAKALKRLGT